MPYSDPLTVGPARSRGAEPDPRLRLELPSSQVRALMEAGLLKVEGMRCLDHQTKEVVRRLCLECCLSHECSGRLDWSGPALRAAGPLLR